jgi:translation initiation factor IF-2
MGHIDHGKSTLLDYIRKANIVAGEAGGITQHLGAYEVLHTTSEGKQGKLTFLDTPGHEAFCSIRERGAHSADVAVLVVSAEDGVKPQTIEALKCIIAEKIPYIVAINKIDKPSANIELTKQSLAENEIYVEGYGGDIPVVPISAIKGDGIPELLDMILLVTDLQDLKANPEVNAEGTIIEAKRDSKKGISATLLIKNGTIKSGMYVVVQDAISPVRIL